MDSHSSKVLAVTLETVIATPRSWRSDYPEYKMTDPSLVMFSCSSPATFTDVHCIVRAVGKISVFWPQGLQLDPRLSLRFEYLCDLFPALANSAFHPSGLDKQVTSIWELTCYGLVSCPGGVKTLICLTLQKPEISTDSMDQLACKGFSFSLILYYKKTKRRK